MHLSDARRSVVAGMENERRRWRTRFVVFSTAAFVVFMLWVTSTPFSLLGLMAISFPIVALIYMASFSASRAYPHVPDSGSMNRRWASLTRRLPAALVILAFLWLAAAGTLFIAAGDWKFGVFGLAISFVFLVAAFPGKLTTWKIAIMCVGLVVAAVLFIL